MVVMLNHCCCGCTLKTGTIIIAVLEILGSISCLGTSIKMAAGYDEITSDTARQFGFSEEDRDIYNSARKVNTIFGIISATMGAINLILSIMLILGANNDNPRLIKPWLVYSVVCQALTCILFLILSIIWMVYGQIILGIITLFIAGIVVAIATYFILVIYSFYRQLLGVPSKI